jgi:hypothetical protein
MGLRDEIIESQKARADLFKWKFISVAAIGAAALGVGAASSTPADKPEYLMCLVPFVCIYIDALCYQINLRIMVIGQFLRVNPDRAGVADEAQDLPYETFVDNLRRSPNMDPFVFEDFALYWSSRLLSALVIVLGVLSQFRLFHNSIQGEPAIFYITGGLGVLAAIWAPLACRKRVAAIIELADKEKQLAEDRRARQPSAA